MDDNIDLAVEGWDCPCGQVSFSNTRSQGGLGSVFVICPNCGRKADIAAIPQEESDD